MCFTHGQTQRKQLFHKEEGNKKIIDDFKNSKVQFHTFTSPENRTKQVVLKAAPNMNTNDIKQELLRKGIKVQKCTKLKSKNQYYSFYLISTDREEKRT